MREMVLISVSMRGMVLKSI